MCVCVCDGLNRAWFDDNLSCASELKRKKRKNMLIIPIVSGLFRYEIMCDGHYYCGFGACIVQRHSMVDLRSQHGYGDVDWGGDWAFV